MASRKREINKIETVRILRARPAFYPASFVKEKSHYRIRGDGSSPSKYASRNLSELKAAAAILHTSEASSINTGHAALSPSIDFELQAQMGTNPLLGKHITLRMDRAGDLKRKRRHNLVLPPAMNLQQRQ